MSSVEYPIFQFEEENYDILIDELRMKLCRCRILRIYVSLEIGRAFGKSAQLFSANVSVISVFTCIS